MYGVCLHVKLSNDMNAHSVIVKSPENLLSAFLTLSLVKPPNIVATEVRDRVIILTTLFQDIVTLFEDMLYL